MRLSTLQLIAVAMVTLCGASWAETTPKEYKAGGAESVKKWGPKDFDLLKGGYQPTVVYVCDPDPKKNMTAFHYEGKDGLNNADLKDKIAKFNKIKIKADGTDAKGWPEALRKPAEKGASVIFMSSDLTMQIIFDKSKDSAERSLPSLIAAATAIQAHEDKLRAIAEKKDKAEHPVVEEKKKDEMDLTIKIDPKKPDPKAPKKGDPKKPGDKVADAKNMNDALRQFGAGANMVIRNPATHR